MKRCLILLLLVAIYGQHTAAQGKLEDMFRNPTDEAKPIMIWQWMDGLVSKEEMRAGIDNKNGVCPLKVYKKVVV